jgi:hypothetical protein
MATPVQPLKMARSACETSWTQYRESFRIHMLAFWVMTTFGKNLLLYLPRRCMHATRSFIMLAAMYPTTQLRQYWCQNHALVDNGRSLVDFYVSIYFAFKLKKTIQYVCKVWHVCIISVCPAILYDVTLNDRLEFPIPTLRGCTKYSYNVNNFF